MGRSQIVFKLAERIDMGTEKHRLSKKTSRYLFDAVFFVFFLWERQWQVGSGMLVEVNDSIFTIS